MFGFGSISVLTSLGVADSQGISWELTECEKTAREHTAMLPITLWKKRQSSELHMDSRFPSFLGEI